jgi:hypothetical protein
MTFNAFWKAKLVYSFIGRGVCGWKYPSDINLLIREREVSILTDRNNKKVCI